MLWLKNALNIIPKLALIILIIALLGESQYIRAADDDDVAEPTRPRRVRVTGSDSLGENRVVERDSVSVQRRRRHGVVYRAAVSTAQGTANVVSTAGVGLYAGTIYAAKKTGQGASFVGRNTGTGVKVAAHGTTTAGKAVINAFR